MLNLIWLSFFIIAFIVSLVQWLVFGNIGIFEQLLNSIISMSKVTVEIAIGLIGILSFWLGMMKIAEAGGVVNWIANAISPLFSRLMPEVPKNHQAFGSITMNLSANFLGLDNAATPLGLKAMKDLQEINPKKDTASNAQILFLVLNTSSVTLFPISVFVYRAQQGAAVATDVFLPILLATFASTIAGLISVAMFQRISIYKGVILAYLGAAFAVVAALVVYLLQLSAQQLSEQSSLMGNLLIILVLVCFLVIAHLKKINVYDTFITGAKEGFEVSIKLIPYLLAMLVGIGVFRASGALDMIVDSIRTLVAIIGGDTRFVDALPTAFMKPLSGSGADSFAGRLASIMQGSTETTFYVLAVYFGSVGIRYSRHAITCGLIADVAGISAGIAVCYWFFG
mgnify:CR=1 FL=1